MKRHSFAVLYVDDDENDRLLLQRAWRQARIDNPIYLLESHDQLVAYLEGKGTYADRDVYRLPCVILLDLHLDGRFGGLDSLRWIRGDSRYRTLSVVVLSGTASPKEVDMVYDAGANSVLEKSLSDRLEKLVGLLKEYWLVANVPPSECFAEGH